MPESGRKGQERVSQAKAELFRVLGHPMRVRILELLRGGERSVGDLQQALGLDASGTSQHLGSLRNRDLVTARRDGKNVYYSIKDPLTTELLEVARRLITTRIENSQSLLEQLAEPENR
ncbi:MAG: helix-turn-helix transcriptional regulator [Thermoleophilia bacterium]|nr:helix-turn-helix transcriptional regulator [Thermoleophilia bacterium]